MKRSRLIMKVISFCLWGNDPKYCEGAIQNVKLASEIYPDWECWFFVDNTVPEKIIDELDNLQHNLNYHKVRVIAKDKEGGWEMMLDRLSPTLEPSVDLFISRDCDSRLSQREKAAVDEWIDSDCNWHLMSDHPYHSVPIMGGMFGVKKPAFEDLYERALSWKEHTKSEWQQDQNFLKDMIWPTIGGDYVRHDDGFFNHLWGGQPFPTKREGLEFVGQVFDEKENIVSEHTEALRKAIR